MGQNDRILLYGKKKNLKHLIKDDVHSMDDLSARWEHCCHDSNGRYRKAGQTCEAIDC